jgi:hypothetical protein
MKKIAAALGCENRLQDGVQHPQDNSQSRANTDMVTMGH